MAGRRVLFWAVRKSIYRDPTGTADTFSTVRLKRHGVPTRRDQTFVEPVKDLKDGHRFIEVVDRETFPPRSGRSIVLAKDLQLEFHA